MKKFTLLLTMMLAILSVQAQEVTGFTSLGDWIQFCDAQSLTNIDFIGGPTVISECGTEISSSTENSCFPPGELKEGFSITLCG